MPRRQRYLQWTDAACYHVINRGHARETIYHDDLDHRQFMELFDRYRQRFELRIYHYCLMSNHFHLVLQLPEPRALSRMVAGLLVAYWRHYRRRHGLVGHLFQRRFKSPAIDADAYLLSCGRYVERNPLEAGMVVQPGLCLVKLPGVRAGAARHALGAEPVVRAVGNRARRTATPLA